MTRLCLLILLALFSSPAFAQVNVALLHQLVSENKSEYDRQTQARDNHAVVGANELANRSMMSSWKNTYRDIQSRFNAVSFALDAAKITLEAAPLVDDILQSQKQVFEFCKDEPLLIAFSAEAELDLTQQALSLSRYLYGLILSIGEINQMRPSDRKILFAGVISELRRMSGTSAALLRALQQFKSGRWLMKQSPFSPFVNRDKALASDIATKIKILK